MLLGFLSIEAQAQTWVYKATELAIKLEGQVWSDWKPVRIKVEIDVDNDFITIFSGELQVYKVTSNPIVKSDCVSFSVIDQDYDSGTIRLRVDDNGKSQIYVDFADISWVYNLVRIN